jgi:hypothetical protein
MLALAAKARQLKQGRKHFDDKVLPKFQAVSFNWLLLG